MAEIIDELKAVVKEGIKGIQDEFSGPSVTPEPGLDDRSLAQALISMGTILFVGLGLAVLAAIAGLLAFKKHLDKKPG